MTDAADIRKGMPDPKLSRAEFEKRFQSAFRDPAYKNLAAEIEKITGVAWDAYDQGRKAPITEKAGAGYADPTYDLSVDWIAAKNAINEAQKRHDDDTAPRRVLLINASPRSEHTCPGEMSKTYRLVEMAQAALAEDGIAVDLLDLSRITSEYGRQIHPCKACFSTAAPLCHWPCSCYPNHAEGQVHDWMNEIYPLWVAAHGVMIITPVHWYQSPSPLKLMIDRLVCADGGNPDPTSTHGKKAAEAKARELAGWDYPQHLAGRIFSVVVHGDTEGVENLRRTLVDWLHSIGLVSAGYAATLDRYIGYWQPYATSHQDLDKDTALQEETRLAARTLAAAIMAQYNEGCRPEAETGLSAPRKK